MPALFLKIVLSGFLYKRLMSSIFLPFIFFLSIVQLLPSRSSLFPLFYNFFAFLVELFLSAGLFHPIPFSSTLPDFLIYSSLLLYIYIFIYPLPSLHFFSLFLSVWFGDKCPLWMFDSAGSTAAAAVSSLAFHSGEKAGAAKMSNWLCKYSSACGVGIKVIFILFKKNKLYGKQEILAHSFRVFILITCFTLVDSTGESLNDFYLLSCWKWKHIFIFSWLSCRFQPFKGWSIKELRENKMLKKRFLLNILTNVKK